MASRPPSIEDRSLLAVPPLSRGATREDQALLARMHAELRDGFDALASAPRGVSVFGSARVPPGDSDYELARAACARLGSLGFAIITGGGAGIMEAANRGARDAGTMSIGLLMRPDANEFLDVALRFHYFFARKVMFVRYASAFVVFPGGFGTLDELFELVALMQGGSIQAPPVVLVNRRYWTPMIDWLRERALPEGKVTGEELGLVALADDVDEVCAGVAAVGLHAPASGDGEDPAAELPNTTA
jgi:uncharacterized protein (TIGR00730 family)